MNLIDLAWIGVFIGGSAVAGFRSGGWVGGLIGFFLGYLMLVGIANLGAWWEKQWPSCTCGNSSSSGFRVEEHDELFFIHVCDRCSSRFVMRKGFMWDEVSEAGERTPCMRRGFLGRWRETGPLCD